MTTRLTPKQEAFVRAYVETGNASEAYRKIYNASRMKPETVNRKAKELLDNGKITARVDELRARLDDEAIANAKERQRWWTQVMRNDAVDMKDRLKASELLGKVQGDFVERREISGPNGQPIPARVEVVWGEDEGES